MMFYKVITRILIMCVYSFMLLHFSSQSSNLVEKEANSKDEFQSRKIDSSCSCGIPNVKSPKRELSEETNFMTSQQEHPWMVQVSLSNGGFCAGTVINNLLILTAAHCILNSQDPENNSLKVVVPPDKVSVQWGILEDDVPEENLKIPCLGVSKVIAHPDFRQDGLDIALLILEKPLNFSTFHGPRPICLSNDNNDIIHKLASTITWDYELRLLKTLPVFLAGRDVRVMPLKTCTTHFFVDNDLKYDNFFCSVGDDHKEMSQMGNSGSPLLKQSSSQSMQIGVLMGGINEFTIESLPKTSIKAKLTSPHMTTYAKISVALPFINSVAEHFESSWCNSEAVSDKDSSSSKDEKEYEAYHNRIADRFMTLMDAKQVAS